MKKLLLFWSAAALLLGSACSEAGFDAKPGNKPEASTELVRMYVSDETTEAQNAADPQSRAAFTEGYKIAWETGDQVAIVRGTPYTVQQDESGRWYVELPQADSYEVYYPAALCGTVDQGMLVSKVPDSQVYHSGSFDPAALPARAVAKRGERLVFKYMCSVVKLTLRGTEAEQVTRIRLMNRVAGTGDELFCAVGTIETEADGTAYLAPMTGEYKKYSRNVLSLTVDNAALSEEGVDFYMTIFPTTFSKGFVIEVTLSDGRQMIKVGGATMTAARGRVLAMPPIRFVESSTTAPVLYSTDNVNYLPWEYASGTTPAELPYPQTENHRLYFKDNPSSTATTGLTAAHLQYLHDTFITDGEVNGNGFATVVAKNPIGFDFSRATYESTELSAGIFTRYGEAANQYNTNLRYISLPSNIKEVADRALCWNLVLHTVILPPSVEKVGAYVFEVSRGLHSTGDSPDPNTQGVFCYATTPPSFGANAFNWNNGNFHVPASSLAAYESVWASDPLGAKLSRMVLVGDL